MDRSVTRTGDAEESERPSGPTYLPPLRDDLEFVPGAVQEDGSPSHVIFDRAANRYFEIGEETHRLLQLWPVRTVDGLRQAAEPVLGRPLGEDELDELIKFLITSALVRDIPGDDYKLMAQKQADQQRSLLSKAAHSYLFFRIPLVRPDRFLQATWPVVAPLFTRTAVQLFAVVALVGLYLVSRQWEHFASTFQYMLSWEGAAIYGASLVIVKSLHELGHAYMAVRYGLRVPTIGIAFMVLMPVLYTDTSGAWRLPARRKRLMIDGAGIMTELVLAASATLLWAFLDDGPVRLCVFAIATTSWVTSLAVNLNPLMRFDGYYILSDAIGFPNMQARGFEMARWRLRELLFGLGAPAPEQMTPGRRRLVVAHAWATWIYRFFLFLGIALLVYSFFIKIVGIGLFIAEIVWFIALPIWRELKVWFDIRRHIMVKKRIWLTGAIAASMVALALVPLSTTIVVPSIMLAAREQALYAPFPARIETIRATEGRRVAKGDILFMLDSPKLDRDRRLARERKALLESRIDRSGSDLQDRASLVVLTNELHQVREELAGLDRISEKLTIRAPFDGLMRDVDPEIHKGLWVGAKASLATLVADRTSRIEGYVGEKDVFRFSEGATATFIPDNPDRAKVAAKVSVISDTNADVLKKPYLALKFGGSIAIEEGDASELKPMHAAFAVALAPKSSGAVAWQDRAIRGVTHIEGEARSVFDRVRVQVLKVFVREMGV